VPEAGVLREAPAEIAGAPHHEAEADAAPLAGEEPGVAGLEALEGGPELVQGGGE
jgi:hypothetical protein